VSLTPRPTPGLAKPAQAAKLALRSLARRIQDLNAEIADFDIELTHPVARAPCRAAPLLGISTGHAGQLLVTTGQNIDRLHSEGAFAALCGASPIPASSGRTTRHRLNYGGDRDANRMLYMIAVCRLRYCPRTQAYAARHTQRPRPPVFCRAAVGFKHAPSQPASRRTRSTAIRSQPARSRTRARAVHRPALP
jgi:transposase